MNRLHGFPEAPRLPAWRRSLRVRWPLGAVGIALVATGLVTAGGVFTRERAVGALVLPGIALVMLWMRAIFRFRVLLTSGVITPRIAADGRRTFHDADGKEHEVRDADPASGADAAAVVFDPHEPGNHRLVTPEDFVTGART